uniref:Lipase domain-containing protein n=1 Tax=Anopheles maculatus TaxID=74869 RepID=A0A182TB53_9DIPT
MEQFSSSRGICYPITAAYGEPHLDVGYEKTSIRAESTVMSFCTLRSLRGLFPTIRRPILYDRLTFNYTEEGSSWYCDDVFFSVLKQHVKHHGNDEAFKGHSIIQQLSFAETANISFHLFTRQNPTVSQRLIPTIESVNASYFNASRPTRVIVHGFCNCQHSDFCQSVKDALLYANDLNIISIDWSDTAGLLDYILLRLRLSQVAASLAHFVDFLHNTTDLDMSQ